MQKIDFIESIEKIIIELKTNEILQIFRAGFNQPGNVFAYDQINPLLFASKSSFDNLMNVETLKVILTEFKAPDIYEEKNLSFLTQQLRGNKAANLLSNNKVVQLYSFHDSISNLHSSGKKLLIGDEFQNSFEEDLEEGFLIFRIVIADGGLTPSEYSKILTALDELIKAINKVKHPEASEDSDEPRILLLDSGSDTNLGIKSTAETAKSLFLIFKEIWDYTTNHRFYKEKQKNDSLLESLTLRKEIMKMSEDGVITEDEAKEYSFLVKTRADSLIGLKVLPKVLVESKSEIDNKNLLEEYKEMKLLAND